MQKASLFLNQQLTNHLLYKQQKMGYLAIQWQHTCKESNMSFLRK
jgi:hypothetical protein